jgi:hypothetical protein
VFSGLLLINAVVGSDSEIISPMSDKSPSISLISFRLET